MADTNLNTYYLPPVEVTANRSYYYAIFLGLILLAYFLMTRIK